MFVLLGAPAFAQSGAGSIRGTVQDPSGAIIPGASVHVVNQATKDAFDAKTNSAGLYTVPSLFTGNYTVTFSAPGMASLEKSLDLQAAQSAVLDATLHPGGVTDKVVVQGNAIQLATYDSPTISETLDNQRINQIPMNQRQIVTLNVLTTPGLEGGAGLNNLRANGNMPGATEYVQDGASLADRNFGGTTNLMPDPDSVQEVRIETSNSSAKFATPGTAVLTTKSGGNQFHGSLFETARNNYFGVAKRRQDASNLQAPHLVRNEFGASGGGPIIIPRLYDGRNKTFFFVAFERYSIAQTVSGQFNVPTQAMRNGDFSGINAGNGLTFQQLYDPATTYNSGAAPCVGTPGSASTPYCRLPMQFNGQNNVIDPSRESPLAKQLYQFIPLPTASLANVNPRASFNYIAPEPNNDVAPNFTTRVDHTLNENNRLYVRYTQASQNGLSWNATNPGAPNVAAPGMPAATDNMSLSVDKLYGTAIGYTHIFSPTLFSETVVSGEWVNLARGGNVDFSYVYRKQWGLPENFGLSSFSVTGLLSNVQMNRYSYEGSQRVFNFDENFSKTLGRHQLNFGARYRYETLGVLPDQTTSNNNFNGMGTGLINPTASGSGQTPNTGMGDADLFIGYASSYGDALTGRHLSYHDQELDTYIQDDWHVSPKLTANIGLRFEVHPAAVELNGQNNGFDFANNAIVTPVDINTLIARGATTQSFVNALESLGAKFETAPAGNVPSGMINGSNVFGPRIGLSYAPWGTRSTVFRGGFGRYVYPIPLRNYYASQASNTPYGYTYTQSFTTPSQSSPQYSDGIANYILRYAQPVVAGQNSANVISTGATGVSKGAINMMFLSPHFPPNIVSQGNFTVEQPLKWGSVLRISWDYDHGSNLDQYYLFNESPSGYVWMQRTGTAPLASSYLMANYDRTFWGPSTSGPGGLYEDARTGFSTDNALQANLERQYRNGWAFQMFYVYSMAFRIGGNTFRDSFEHTYGSYSPGSFSEQATQPLWATSKELDRLENWNRDTAIPQHRIRANGIYDLPFGRNKRFFSGVNHFVDELIGGYEIAGDMNLASQYFAVTSSNYGGANPVGTGTLGKVKLYGKHQYPVTDCSSGTCLKGYQLFNGFINPLQINDPCGPSPYTGLQTKDQPYETPINVDPGTVTCSGTSIKTSNPNYLNNNVAVKLADGSTQPVGSADGKTIYSTAYSPGPVTNPYSKALFRGPYNWTADISIFKVFPIHEQMNLRINMDAFNVFNIQGASNPSSTTGIQYFTSSPNTPRQIQLSGRFTF